MLQVSFWSAIWKYLLKSHTHAFSLTQQNHIIESMLAQEKNDTSVRIHLLSMVTFKKGNNVNFP